MPGSDALHSALTGTNIHVPYRFTYADATAREAEAGAVPGDVGCLALQQDDNSLWILTDDDPLTWVSVADAGGAVVDASDATYTPTTDADWDGSTDPGNVDAALDQLAERVADVEPTALAQVATINFVIDGGGSAIATGIKGDVEIPWAGTINQVTMLADQPGSIVVDIWKDSYANFPPDDADSITAAAPPTIATATKSQDSTLTAWTTAVAAGDILRFNVDSCDTIERCTVSLKITRTA
jgi:hypothetical protein